MAEVAYEVIFPNTSNYPVDLTSDAALPSSAMGKNVTVSPVGSAYKSLRTTPEASWPNGGSQYIQNGTSTAFLCWSSDWGRLHAKIGASTGTMEVSRAGGIYAYTRKTNLSAQTFYEREDMTEITNNLRTSMGVIGTFHVQPMSATAYCWGFNSGGEVYAGSSEWDSTTSQWRHSAPVQVSTGGSVWGIYYVVPIDGSVTRFIVIFGANSSGSSPGCATFSQSSAWARMFTVTPLSTPTPPSVAATAAGAAFASWDFNWNGNGSGLVCNGMGTQYHYVISVGAIAPNNQPYATGGSLYFPYNGSWFAQWDSQGTTTVYTGVATLSYNTGTGSVTYAGRNDYASANSATGNATAVALAKIPGSTKGVFALIATANSNKLRAAVYTNSGFGTTIDLATHNNTTLESCVSVMGVSSTRGVATSRNATNSVNDASHKRAFAVSFAINTGTNALTLDGNEIELMGGRRVTTIKPFLEDTTNLGFGVHYKNSDITGTLDSVGVETYSLSTATLSLRGSMTLGSTPYFRPIGISAYVFYQSGTSPRLFVHFNSFSSSTSTLVAYRLRETAGVITQASDGSPYGGYSRN